MTFIGNAIESNDSVTAPIGPVMLSLMAVKTLGLPELLDLLKRRQGASVTDITVALMAHAMQMRGLSISRMGDILDYPNRLKIYKLDNGVDKNDLYFEETFSQVRPFLTRHPCDLRRIGVQQ